MLAMRIRGSKSWLSERGGRVNAASLSDRLLSRCRGETGVFLTLTYRRDEWNDPQELYERASEQRHVRRFIEDLSRFLGYSLTGRWLCKMEFQRGGWVHWHLIILGPKYVPHDALSELWGHGFVFVRRLTPKGVRYTCKYVAKGDDLPGWLYLMPCRSVKVIRASPGFWPPTERKRYARSDRMRLSAYVSIGQCIERAEQETSIRDDQGRFATMRLPLWLLVHRFTARGARVVGSEGSWMLLHGVNLDNLRRMSRPPASGEAAAGGGLHLKETRNPPGTVPAWLGRVFEWTEAQRWAA